MGKERFIVNPFPPMELSVGDKAELQGLVAAFIDEHFPRYEEYVTVDRRQADAKQWKLIKAKDNIRVHAKREATTTDGGPRPTLTEASDAAGIPVVLCEGTMPGNLEDTMFGVVNPTLEIMRVKASYVDDLSGAAVLATISKPTPDEPLQSLVLKWMELDLPLHSTNLVKNRDYVYMEATGIVFLANGERVGYHVLHSIGLPQAHELPNRIRGNLHVCGFFRQEREHSVEVHATGVCDPGGNVMRSLLLYPVALTFLSCVKYGHCGEMKKLAWFMHKRYTEAKELGAPRVKDACVNCAVPVTGRRFGNFGKTRHSCKLCFGFVCRSCRVQKRLSFVTPDLQLEQRKVTFCPGCIKEALSFDTMEAARAQILDAQSVYRADTGVSFTSSSDSS